MISSNILILIFLGLLCMVIGLYAVVTSRMNSDLPRQPWDRRGRDE